VDRRVCCRLVTELTPDLFQNRTHADFDLGRSNRKPAGLDDTFLDNERDDRGGVVRRTPEPGRGSQKRTRRAREKLWAYDEQTSPRRSLRRLPVPAEARATCPLSVPFAIAARFNRVKCSSSDFFRALSEGFRSLDETPARSYPRVFLPSPAQPSRGLLRIFPR